MPVAVFLTSLSFQVFVGPTLFIVGVILIWVTPQGPLKKPKWAHPSLFPDFRKANCTPFQNYHHHPQIYICIYHPFVSHVQ